MHVDHVLTEAQPVGIEAPVSGLEVSVGTSIGPVLGPPGTPIDVVGISCPPRGSLGSLKSGGMPDGFGEQ